MQKYVEDVRNQPKQYVRERKWIERLLNWAPASELNQAKPIMYKDKWSSWGKTLLLELDFDFMMLDVCTISFIEFMARDNTDLANRTLLGVLVAYILDYLLIWIRAYFGKKNLSRHTLVDESFLV